MARNTIFVIGQLHSEHIELGLALGTDFDYRRHPRLERRTSRGGAAGWCGWQAKFIGSVRIYRSDQIDDEFRDLVRVACEKN